MPLPRELVPVVVNHFITLCHLMGLFHLFLFLCTLSLSLFPFLCFMSVLSQQLCHWPNQMSLANQMLDNESFSCCFSPSLHGHAVTGCDYTHTHTHSFSSRPPSVLLWTFRGSARSPAEDIGGSVLYILSSFCLNEWIELLLAVLISALWMQLTAIY